MSSGGFRFKDYNFKYFSPDEVKINSFNRSLNYNEISNANIYVYTSPKKAFGLEKAQRIYNFLLSNPNISNQKKLECCREQRKYIKKYLKNLVKNINL